jgi:predicted dehydrogenase
VSGQSALIVGGGAVGVDFHLPRLLSLCSMADVTIVEVDARRRVELSTKLGARKDVQVLSALPAARMYEIAVIATPPRLHAPYVDELKHRCQRLLIEKPLAHSLAASEAIVASLVDASAQPFVCHIRRALSSFALVRALRERGDFGRLLEVRMAEGGVFSWKAASMGSFSRELNGGGVLQDTGPHAVDLLCQVFDDLDLERAWMDADVQSGTRAIEANCVLRLRGDGGVSIELSLSRNRNFSNQACFRFERASMAVDVRDNSVRLTLDEGIGVAGVALDGPLQRLEYHELFDAFYRRFVAAGDNRGVTPADALRVARIIDAAYRRAEPMAGEF